MVVFVIAAANCSEAQQFGGNPPAIKWQQINTKAAKVIFPKGLDSAASEVANIVQQMNSVIQPTIGNKQKQISIVLQNQTTISNAYVGLAPFRSEFFLTPSQNSFEIGSLPWAKQLAIHEFRHVQQYNNFNVGFSKVLRTLFGEGGQALGNDLSIPNWFFEGDAVYNETLVSAQGRGRLPYFFNGYRALWAANKQYSWMKLRNGSYRDYVPDWYPTGYMMVAYGREKYGNDFWKNVTHDAAAFAGGLYPLQRAIKKYSGADFKHYTDSAFGYFKNQFKTDRKAEVDSKSVVQSAHFVANEEYPAYVNDKELIYMKTTYNHLPAFVLRKDNEEHIISIRSTSLDSYFDYNQGKIVYAAYRPDVRWAYRDYSELMLLDVATGHEQRITKATKYFSPAFNADNKMIVAVQVDPSGKSNLHIINTHTGQPIRIVPNPEQLFYTYPKFYGDSKLIAAVRNRAGQMSIAMIDAATGKAHYLLQFAYRPIGFMQIKNEVVYFTATTGINDKLYAYHLDDGKVYQLKNEPSVGNIGEYQPAISTNKLAFVGFTAVGYQINEYDKPNVQWTEIQHVVPDDLPTMGITALNNNAASNLLSNIKDEPHEASNYPKTHHLFNFHSLIPNINDPNYSLALSGQNVLNTFQSEISFDYNRNEGYKQLGFDAVYGAWFPYLRGGVSYTLDRRALYKGNSVFWNQTDVHAGLEIPLTLSSGKNITGLDFGSSIYFSGANFQAPYNTVLKSSNYTYISHYLTFTNHIQRATQNIFPRWGQSLSLAYKSTISGSSANQFLAIGKLFLPGAAINHHLVISAAYQQNNANGGVNFSNNFPFSYGYAVEAFHLQHKIGVDYHFPIAYPDAGVANTVYVLRLRADLFYNATYAADPAIYHNQTINFRSTGGTLFFDTQWFNQASISFGIRYSRLLDNDIFGAAGRNRIELVLPVTFF